MIRTFTFSGASPFGMTPSTTISLLWLFTVAIRAIPFSSWHLQAEHNTCIKIYVYTDTQELILSDNEIFKYL